MHITITRSDVVALNTYLKALKSTTVEEIPDLAPTVGQHQDFSNIDFLDVENRLKSMFNEEAVRFVSMRNDILNVEIDSVVFEKCFAIAIRYTRLYAKSAVLLKATIAVLKPLYESLVKPRFETMQKELKDIWKEAAEIGVWIKTKEKSGSNIH